jgi:adenylyltransferase/sulfurtransferase
MGLLQATEVLKLILGIGDELVGKLLLYDALEVNLQKMNIPKDEKCQLCGPNPSIKSWNSAGSVPIVDDLMLQDSNDNSDQVSVQWLNEKLSNGSLIRLIDVRETHELEICQLKETEHHPVKSIQPEKYSKDSDEIIVFYCHRGVRSQRVVRIFKELGHKNCRSLIGGIDAWAEEIEPEMPRY